MILSSLARALRAGDLLFLSAKKVQQIPRSAVQGFVTHAASRRSEG